MLFLKGDTVEHDKHTGHFGSRTKGVKNLCRYCVCPSSQIDEPYADFARKSPEMLVEYIQKWDMKGLKRLSQQFIMNNWYEFMFGLHNNLNIHGACPMELLHWIQLGWYKYSRSTLFEKLGPYSELSRQINTIASQMGWLFQRQSDRAFPRTRFTKGVQKGKLMAHEMSGMILVIIATLRSSSGRKAILASKHDKFPNQEAISSWVMMLELQLQFEHFLKSDSMSVAVVIRLRTKVRELMALIKFIGQREKGMAYKTNNFHSTKHVPDDILIFGPPHCVNTMSNEMHHKPDKKSAQSTQKRPGTFDMQCTERVEERRVLEMAIQELMGRPRWDYFCGFDRENQHKSDRFLGRLTGKKQQPTSPSNKPKQYPHLTGVQAKFEYDDKNQGYGYKVFSTMKRKKRYKYPQFIVGAIADLTEELAEYTDSLTVFSELYLNEHQKFRAAPFFQGKPWYDWAICRVGEQIEGFEQRIDPVHIRCFVDLTFLPEQNNTKHAPGYYMIAETTRMLPNQAEIILSDLFVPHVKEAHPTSVNKLELFASREHRVNCLRHPGFGT